MKNCLNKSWSAPKIQISLSSQISSISLINSKMKSGGYKHFDSVWGIMNISEVYLQTILEEAVRNAFPKTISLLSAEQRKHTERQKYRKTEKLKCKRQLYIRQCWQILDPTLMHRVNFGVNLEIFLTDLRQITSQQRIASLMNREEWKNLGEWLQYRRAWKTFKRLLTFFVANLLCLWWLFFKCIFFGIGLMFKWNCNTGQ